VQTSAVPVGILLQLGWRNLWRHRRRNGMLMLAIVVAVATVVLANSLLRGWQTQMLETVVENLTGHVMVQASGYREDPSIQRGFTLPPGYQPHLGDSSMAGWASRVRVPGVILSERDTRGVQLVGIDPAEEQRISFLADVVIEGEALTAPDDRRVLIGRALAERLNTGVGRRIVLMTQGSDGRNREAGFRVAGLYRATMGGLEKVFVFTGREALQAMLDSEAVTELSVRLQNNDQRVAARERLQRQFTDAEAATWDELEPMAANLYRSADLAILIWFSIMMTALAFGLVNTLITAVMERVRELGMLRAIGMQASAVMLQVVFECLMIVILGVLLGIAVGVVLVFSLSDGIDLSQWAAGIESYYMSAILVPQLLPGDLLLVLGLSLLFGLLASAWPAWRAVRIKPLEAMRH
jgi:ABC-type lipoprotein release transport system permease subunit